MPDPQRGVARAGPHPQRSPAGGFEEGAAGLCNHWTTGLHASRLWLIRGTDRPTQLTDGTQLRYDDITPVGPYGTKARERLSTGQQRADRTSVVEAIATRT